MQPLILLSSSMYCKITSLHVSAEVRHFSYAESVRHCLHVEIDFDERWHMERRRQTLMVDRILGTL